MSSWSPTPPAAIAGLITAFQTWPGLAGVDVWDGPKVTEADAKQVIAVGFTGSRMSTTGVYPEPTTPAVEFTANYEGLAVIPLNEQYTVRSLLAVLNGSSDITAARTDAYGLLAACVSALAADKTLGQAVATARVGAHTLVQEQAPKGAIATIYFDVEITAWTKRVS